MLADGVCRNDHFLNVALRRNLVHDVLHHLLNNRPQGTSAGGAFDGFFGNSLQSVIGELQLDAVKLKELGVLLDQRVLWLGQNRD